MKSNRITHPHKAVVSARGISTLRAGAGLLRASQRASEVLPLVSTTTWLGKPVRSFMSCSRSKDVKICARAATHGRQESVGHAATKDRGRPSPLSSLRARARVRWWVSAPWRSAPGCPLRLPAAQRSSPRAPPPASRGERSAQSRPQESAHSQALLSLARETSKAKRIGAEQSKARNQRPHDRIV